MLGCAFNHHYHDENVVKRLFYGLRSFLSQASILTVLTPDSTYERYKDHAFILIYVTDSTCQLI